MGRVDGRELAVALFDLAWLLPRTVGAEERQVDPLPRSELEVMRLLGRRPGLGVNAVARELGLRPSNVSASVRALLEKGLVERRPSPDDGRQVLLHLTETAERTRKRRERGWGRELDHFLGRLSARDRDLLLAAAPALRELAQRLSDTRRLLEPGHLEGEVLVSTASPGSRAVAPGRRGPGSS